MSTPAAPPASPSPAHTAYDYALVDVFAERPLEGNQLAIFTDGRSLSEAEMQALARETNLSETTFLFPRSPEIERERGVQVRILPPRRSFPSPAIPRSAPRAGSTGTILRCAEPRRSSSTWRSGASPYASHRRNPLNRESSEPCDRTIQFSAPRRIDRAREDPRSCSRRHRPRSSHPDRHHRQPLLHGSFAISRGDPKACLRKARRCRCTFSSTTRSSSTSSRARRLRVEPTGMRA